MHRVGRFTDVILVAMIIPSCGGRIRMTRDGLHGKHILTPLEQVSQQRAAKVVW